MRGRDKLQTERMQRFLPLVHSLIENEDGSALLAMLLDDYYQANFHPSFVPAEVNKAPVFSERKEARPSPRPRDRKRR